VGGGWVVFVFFVLFGVLVVVFGVVVGVCCWWVGDLLGCVWGCLWFWVFFFGHILVGVCFVCGCCFFFVFFFCVCVVLPYGDFFCGPNVRGPGFVGWCFVRRGLCG
ncbi:hypothetical protein V2J61_00020, partial [Pseudomonas aeruginosa]|uniref:hypothetical protein n=1 Tax=Pseudomonas aeruginosa TaxID=287 RepID=UPI002EA83A63|nr:hypothetical protein [Pseudomonas aeruginosa]